MKAEKIKDALETAHDKEVQMIDWTVDEAKAVADDLDEVKTRAVDALRSGASAVTDKAGAVGDAVSKAATDVVETVGMRASEFSAKAGEMRQKTTKRVQEMPWLAPMVAIVLLLALALSIAKRLRDTD